MDEKQLQLLLYLLMRDHMPAGVMEMVIQHFQHVRGCVVPVYSNSYLEAYSASVAARLLYACREGENQQ